MCCCCTDVVAVGVDVSRFLSPSGMGEDGSCS